MLNWFTQVCIHGLEVVIDNKTYQTMFLLKQCKYCGHIPNGSHVCDTDYVYEIVNDH